MPKNEKENLTWPMLLLDARDAHITTKAEQSLLYHLIMRCDPRKNYSCYPRYAQLCLDTGLEQKTLQRAAAWLEKEGYMRRVIRPEQSNLWFVDAVRIHTLAVEKRVEEKREKEEREKCPFAPPTFDGNSTEATSQKMIHTVPKDSAAEEQSNSVRDRGPDEPEDFFILENQLQRAFPEHPSWTGSRNKKQLHGHLLEVVRSAGDVRRACTLIHHFLGPNTPEADALRQWIRDSDHLGAYIKSLIPDWMDSYPGELPDIMNSTEDRGDVDVDDYEPTNALVR